MYRLEIKCLRQMHKSLGKLKHLLRQSAFKHELCRKFGHHVMFLSSTLQQGSAVEYLHITDAVQP